MENNPWLEKGIEEIRDENYFDGYQLVQGALQRAFQNDDHRTAKTVLSKTIAHLSDKNQTNFACDLAKSTIKPLRRKQKDRAWIELIPYSFEILHEFSMNNCIKILNNGILNDKSFQESEFLLNISDLISEASYGNKILSDLFFLYSGLLSLKGDFVECFKTISKWSAHSPLTTLMMRTYLTLAELNAYEIDGCGKYLEIDDQTLINEELNDPTGKLYFAMAKKIFKSIESGDKSKFYFTISEYSGIIDPKKDGLLKSLCDGLSAIFKNQSGSGLLSSFFGS